MVNCSFAEIKSFLNFRLQAVCKKYLYFAANLVVTHSNDMLVSAVSRECIVVLIIAKLSGLPVGSENAIVLLHAH